MAGATVTGMTVVLSVVVLVGCGIVAGVLFAVALSVVPAFLALPPDGYVKTHQLIGRHFDKVMPPLVGLCVVADVILAVRADGPAHRAPFVAAAVLLAGVSLVSQFGNVPINRTVKAQSASALPEGWLDPRPRWRAWHLLRTTLSLLAIVVNACAVVLA